MTAGYYYDGLDRVAKQVGADEIEGVLEYEAFGPIRTLRRFKEVE